MKKALSLGLVTALALSLTACAPNTDAAYKNCYNTLTIELEFEDNGLTYEESVDLMVEVAELCSGLAEANPERFIEEWGPKD